MEKRWKILKADESKVVALQESLKINPALCSILAERGFDTYEKAKQYYPGVIDFVEKPISGEDYSRVMKFFSALKIF